MKKISLILVAVLTGIMFMPNVFAIYEGAVGNVTENSGKDSVGDSNVSGVVNSEDPKNVVITYNALNLKVIGQYDGGEDRGKDAAWVGFHIDTPAGADVMTAKFKVDDAATFDHTVDEKGNYYIDITAEALQKAIDSGTPIVKKISFSWDGVGEEVDQTVTVIIDSAKVVLTAKDNTVEFNGPEIAAERQTEQNTTIPEQTNSKAEEVKTDNPNTADINVYSLILVVFSSACGLVYTVKKRFN